MPYRNAADHAEAVRRYRQRIAGDPVFEQKEAERKARWYEANKVRKNENQNRYRTQRREQALMDMGRGKVI